MIIGSAMLCKRAFFLRPKWPCFHKAEREDGSEAEHGSTWPVIGQGQGTSVVVALQSQNEIRSVMEPFWAVNSNALKRAGGLVQVRGFVPGFWANAVVLPTNSNEATRGTLAV